MQTWGCSLAFLTCALALIVGASPAAGSPRYMVSFKGTDTLSWSVGERPECGRSGSGVQRVVFAGATPVAVGIVDVPSSSGSHFGFGPKHTGLTFTGHGTVTRTDETTGSYWPRSGCVGIPAKDCGTKPLPGFEPVIIGGERMGVTLEGPYWHYDNEAAPFRNCMALQTPEGLAGNESFYTGWRFGESVPPVTPAASPPARSSFANCARGTRTTSRRIERSS